MEFQELCLKTEVECFVVDVVVEVRRVGQFKKCTGITGEGRYSLGPSLSPFKEVSKRKS